MPGLWNRPVPDPETVKGRGSQLSSIPQQRTALLAAKAALEKQAEDVVVIDLTRLSSVTDFFVIATAASRPQTAAIVEQVERTLKQAGRRVRHVEGLEPIRASRAARAAERRSAFEDVSWVLLDCGDVVVHLFSPASRTFYQLERLWGDAPRIPLSSEP